MVPGARDPLPPREDAWPVAARPGYDATRRFYEALGFVALEELHGLWDEENPTLVLVKDVRPGFTVTPVEGLPELREGDDLAGLIAERAELEDGDVVVVAQKAISKSRAASSRSRTSSRRSRRASSRATRPIRAGSRSSSTRRPSSSACARR